MKRLVGAVGVLALLLFGASAQAHVRSTTGYSEIRQDGATVDYTLGLEFQPLAVAVGLGARGVEGTPPEREALLRERRAAVEAYLTERVIVSSDGVQCEGTLAHTGVEQREGTTFARLGLAYHCHEAGAFTVDYSVFDDGGVVDDHRNLVDYRLGGASGTFVFDSGHRELAAGDGGLMPFIGLGVEHILSGIDHVLFLLVLLLGAKSLRQVVKLATAFTVAHSVTLALGALGWVNVPGAIVEPLIALSIFYVALENVFGGETRHRLGVVFAFGLLHGLGFASTLTFTGDLGGHLLASLAGFNVGIELGQALIVAAVFPLLLLARRFRWSPPAHVAVTSMAAAVGMFWFAERLLAA